MSTTIRSNAWSVTINNPTDKDHEEINIARQKGWKVEGQVEKGAEGTPHLQLLVRTPQVRFSAVKKTFSRAHIEAARNVKALEQYVHKEDTREGELPSQSEFYPSLARFWLLITQYMTAMEKDRLDFCELHEGRIKMFRREDEEDASYEQLRALFDDAVRDLILQGYHVEHHAINPANVSAFKRYGASIIRRSYAELIAQTCRQADKKEFTDNDDDDEHTPDAISQEATLPTISSA